MGLKPGRCRRFRCGRPGKTNEIKEVRNERSERRKGIREREIDDTRRREMRTHEKLKKRAQC